MQILRVRFARHYRVIHTHLDRFVICDRPTDRPRYYYIRFRLKAFFSRTTWLSWHQKAKPFWILLKQEMMGWQWHQLDHMQIICTSLQTHNHASTSSLNMTEETTRLLTIDRIYTYLLIVCAMVSNSNCHDISIVP